MASNILNQDGAHNFKYTATGAVTNGSLLIIGATPMVALQSATGAGQVITCVVGAEALLTKKAAASTSWAAGGRVYYIATGGVNKISGVAAAGKMIGYGVEAAVTGATSGKVRLLSGPMPLETAT
jgi:predicted RecA/RadA family phage recombinase